MTNRRSNTPLNHVVRYLGLRCITHRPDVTLGNYRYAGFFRSFQKLDVYVSSLLQYRPCETRGCDLDHREVLTKVILISRCFCLNRSGRKTEMYLLPTTNALLRNLNLNQGRTLPKQKVKIMKRQDNRTEHELRIVEDLKRLGTTKFELLTSESNYLPKIIHPKEQLGGVAFGHHELGYSMLIATDRRIIFLDKKPFFANMDDITYDVISGVSLSHAGFGSTLVLHTRIKDYKLLTMNDKSSAIFVDYIETRCLEHEKSNGKTS